MFILNQLLTNGTGFRIAVGGSLNNVQIILIAFPSTMVGFIMGRISTYPLASAMLPIAILFARGVEDIPNPYEKCQILCKVAEEYHNKELILEMANLDSLIVTTANAIKLPIDKVHLLCVERPNSLLERYKLKKIIRSAKAQRRIQYFREFIKRFPECDVDSETVYREFIGLKERN